MFMPMASPVVHLNRMYTFRPTSITFTRTSFPNRVVDSNARRACGPSGGFVDSNAPPAAGATIGCHGLG